MGKSMAASDPADMLESAIRRALHEHVGGGREIRGDAVRASILESLAVLPTEDRSSVVERILRRNPRWRRGIGGGREGLAEASEAAAGKGGPRADRVREARLERQKQEAEAKVKDVEEQLRAMSEESRKLLKELTERAEACRKLQKRCDLDRDKLAALTAETDEQAATIQSLRTQLDQAQRESRRQSERLIRLDTQLKEARRGGELGPTPPEAQAAVPEPLPPPEPEVIVTSAAYEAFCAALSAENRVSAEEIPPASEDRDRRLGTISAALVALEDGVERVVIAQLDELRRRHTVLAEHCDVLKYFRRSDRTWWWSLTERAGRHVVPERHFARYVGQLNKMNYTLLTAYYKVVSNVISSRARELMSPVSIRRRAGVTRGDELWDFYESRASSEVPRALADDCQAELAKVIDELYRYGTDID